MEAAAARLLSTCPAFSCSVVVSVGARQNGFHFVESDLKVNELRYFTAGRSATRSSWTVWIL